MRPTVVRTLLGGALAASLVLLPSPAVAADPPPNDDFGNGQVILSKGESVAGSNVNSGAEPGEPNHAEATFDSEPLGPLHSIWWSWTATDAGEVKIITCNSDFDTRLGVYTGDAVNNLTPVASALDTNGGECHSIWAGVTFTATAGTTYRIAVDTEGDLAGNGSGPPWGNVALTLTAPPGGEEPPPDDTNPGTDASEEPYTFRMLRVKPSCAEEGSKSVDDCPRKATNLRFYSAEEHQTWANRQNSVVRWVNKLRSKGADINLVMVPKPSHTMGGAVMKYLRSQGKGGEILTQNVAPRQDVTTTSEDPLFLKVSYFDPAEDQKILDATLAALNRAGEDRQNVKSPCEFIDTNATFDMIERKLAETLGAGTLTQKRAGAILKEFGCGYEVAEYIEGMGFTSDVVMDVVGVNKKRNTIQLKVALPVAQDFAFVISEEPEFADVNMLGLGLDGKLTASATQLNRITVQVIERATGRLVPGVKLEFYDTQGKPVTETTNPMGEWTFTSLLRTPGRYAVKASYKGSNGASMVGFRSVDVIDRKQSYTTMSGRTIQWDGQKYVGDQQQINDRKAGMPVVTGILGTGISGAPTAPPEVQQIEAAVPTGNAFVVGQHNAVLLPNDTNYLVGSASGLVTIGGDPSQAPGRSVASRAWPNPFQQAADWLLGILTGLRDADQSGEGTVSEKTSAADQAAIQQSIDTLVANGAQSGGGLISDKGLGLIGQAGGNLIGQAGGNVTPLSGLQLIGQAGGNLIGQAGGNLISDKGLGRPAHRRAGSGLFIGQGNVISLEPNMMPVYGGNVIATN